MNNKSTTTYKFSNQSFSLLSNVFIHKLRGNNSARDSKTKSQFILFSIGEIDIC